MKTIFHISVLLVVWVLGVTVEASSFRTVVIDPGHGGQDLGGQWGQVYEKHLALDTATRLETNLKKLGYQTVMTRRSDYFITLPQRVAIGNSYRNAIFVCIHFNYTWKQQVSGTETFYYSTEGQQLAQCVQGCLVNRTHTIDRSAKFARFYVLRNSTLPAILVEGGFVTNESERNLMKSGGFREAIARGVAEGIQLYRRSY